MKKSLWVLISICGLCLLNACGGGSSGQPLGVATHFSVTSANASPTAGTPFNINVTALDASGQIVATYSGTVHFTSSNGQPVQPASAMVANGTGTFSVTLNALGSQSLTATDTASITGTSISLNVIAASAARPVPLINLPLSPDAIALGGAGFQLTVNGTGFISGAMVEWNGSPRATNFVSESQVTANILPADIANSNTASVTVVNPAPRGGTSNVAFFETTKATSFASWSAPSALATGVNPFSVATADFNGDGKLDLVVANSVGTTVGVLLGNGNGTFQAAVNYPAGTNPVSVAVGDFNGDGKLDLAVANNSTNSLSILLGNGDGTFQAAVNYPAGASPTSVAVGDLNGDGKLDVAVANTGSGNVSIFLGNGDGTFQAAVDYAAGSNPTSVAVGDFNRDGRLDLAVANADNIAIGNVSILLGNGDGTFQSAVNYLTESNSASVAVGDFNGDGKLDLAVANGGAGNFSVGTVSILLGNGDGTFQAAVNYPTKWKSSFVALGDFNGDGKLDLAVSSISSDPSISPSAVSVLIGNGDGTFQLATDHAAGTKPSSIAVGDFNNDGRLDLAVADEADSTVSVLLYPVLAGPNATLSSTLLDFGTQLVGTTSLGSTLILSNDGTATLNISSIAASANFSETDNCGSSLPAGSSCSITVTFVPLADGKLAGTLSITDNAPGSPQTAALHGVATIVKLVPDAMFFNCTGFCQSQKATLTNTGATALAISSFTIISNKVGPNGSAGFAQMNNCPASLPAGQSCTITISFVGDFNFRYIGGLTVQDSDGAQQISLRGFLNP